MSFFKSEAFGGLFLFIATLLAIAIVNLGGAQVYASLLAARVGPLSVLGWINDGLMAFFFFVVGMEIKSEVQDGALASFDRAALPVAGALGGMLMPALIYLVFTDGAARHGWGIPMATDIAFAVGVLSLLGRRVPPQLKIFLLALAIADDLGAVLVIALFYTAQIHFVYLAAAAAVFAALAFVRPLSRVLNVGLGLTFWWLVHHSGVHATIAGCLLGFIVTDPRRWWRKLHAWSSFLVMPVFALANAGLSFAGPLEISAPLVSGIGYGLLFGKPLGIFSACWLAVRFRVARFDGEWLSLLGVAALGGIGFTMSLFIASLALPGEQMRLAKLGIVMGSVLSALSGSLILVLANLKRTRPR